MAQQDSLSGTYRMTSGITGSETPRGEPGPATDKRNPS